MKKKVFAIIITIILIIIVILLGIINNYKAFHFTNKIFFGKQSNKKLYQDSYEDIDTIYVDVDNAIINITNNENDDNKIHVKVLSNKKNIKLKVYNKRLSLKVDNYESCFFCKMNVINISAPSSFREYITVINRHGHISVGRFPNATIALTSKFGNTKVEESKVIKVISKRGSIDIGKTANASIYGIWGTLDIDEVDNMSSKSVLLPTNINYIKKFIDIKNDLGDVNIKKADIVKDSKIEIGFGKINIKNLKEDTGKLTKKN